MTSPAAVGRVERPATPPPFTISAVLLQPTTADDIGSRGRDRPGRAAAVTCPPFHLIVVMSYPEADGGAAGGQSGRPATTESSLALPWFTHRAN